MATHTLKQQTEKVTQEVFDRLPALLTAFTVKTITGFNDLELKEAVDAKKIDAYQRPVRPGRKKSYCKYTKASVGRLVGFRI